MSIAKRAVLFTIVVYSCIGLGFGAWITFDLATEDMAIGKRCRAFADCIAENALILPTVTVAWPFLVVRELIS